MANGKNLWQAYNELPKVARTVIAITVTIGVVYGGYKIYQAIKKAAEAAKSKDDLNKAKDEMTYLKNLGVKQTMPDSQYKIMADELENLLSGYCGPVGTGVFTETTIVQTLQKIKNSVDWLKLQQAFGVRTIKGCGWASNQEISLPIAFKWKLMSLTIWSINSYFTNNNIKYQI